MRRIAAVVGMGVLLVVSVACASSTAAPQAPAAQPAKAVAEPAKPAAQPAQPAVQPAKPAAEAPKPATQPVLELKMGCSQPKGDVLCAAQDKFAELVNQKSKGEVFVRQLYQGLGVEHQLTQAVMSGSVDIGMISNGNSGRFTNAFFNYDLPFLFKTYDNMLRSLDISIGQKAIEQYEKDLGVKLLFAISYGSGRDVQTRNKPLKVPADIKGLKIRVVSTPVDLAIFKAWGANPTPVDWAQTYTALQQGVVEGEQIPMVSIIAPKHYEVVKHSIRLDYQALFQTFYINQKRFESLSPAHQKALLEAAEEAKAWNRRDAMERTQGLVKQLTDLGMTVYQPTPAEYTQWAAVRYKVWQEVAEQQKGKVDLAIAKQLYESQ
ncbi:MAG: TRAP transporter substrate-binding protein [Chloroflexi bacterium]|nr:TRAP transporter substrate-binding protein [Chloroflexota bacterium]